MPLDYEEGKKIVVLIEIATAGPSLIFNVYFAVRFGKLQTYSANLRILIVFLNLLSSVATLSHLLLEFIPTWFYSVANGHYIGAFVFYSLHYAKIVLSYAFGLKFTLIMFERRNAFKHRANYEERNGSDAVHLLTTVISFVAVIVGLQAIYKVMEVGKPIDLRLADAFIIERQPLQFVIYYFVSGISTLVAIADLCFLSSIIKSHKAIKSTLSESFQIKQTESVVEITRHILIGYAVVAVLCMGCFVGMMYDYFVGSRSVDGPLYQFAMNACYMWVNIYLFGSTLYMAWAFRGMRRCILRDLELVCGLRQKEPVVAAPQEMDRHFAYLANQWGAAAVL